jgi:hypothetical protein
MQRVRGTVVAQQGRPADPQLRYVEAGNGVYSARLTPVSADLDDEAAPRRALARRLRTPGP